MIMMRSRPRAAKSAQKRVLRKVLRKALKTYDDDFDWQNKLLFAEHHQSHAASAFFPSPFADAVVLTMDGVGEWATASMGIGRGNDFEILRELHWPDSLGLLYSAFTYFTGFRVNSGEYKVMGLAPYGQPKYKDLILSELMDLSEDGSFRLNQEFFNYLGGLTMTSGHFARLFDGPRREPESELTQREMDLAASVQQVTEEIMLRTVTTAHQQTGLSNLCLAGGVALNCVGNGRILRESPFDQFWIQPAAGDAGGALGVALLIWHQLLDNPRQAGPQDSQRGSLLGPSFDADQVRAYLDDQGAVYEYHADMDLLADRVAGLMADQKVIGWMQGRMEFGPRALGGRSILGDARSREMQSLMNRKIKFRESFRPFAPVVLLDHVHEFFDMDEGQQSPYMLLVADLNSEQLHQLSSEDSQREGLDKLQVSRSHVPAITHVDNSARVQTVDRLHAPLLYPLLAAFHQKTGCPVAVNTSFNIRGEPIVCTPQDAHRCFLATNMDVLVIDGFVLLKDQQPDAPPHEIDDYINQFPLD